MIGAEQITDRIALGEQTRAVVLVTGLGAAVGLAQALPGRVVVERARDTLGGLLRLLPSGSYASVTWT